MYSMYIGINLLLKMHVQISVYWNKQVFQYLFSFHAGFQIILIDPDPYNRENLYIYRSGSINQILQAGSV